MQNNGYFSLFFCYHDNQITMTTNFNILGCQTSGVFQKKTLNRLSIMNINKAIGPKSEKCKIMAIFQCFSVTMTTK